MSPIDRNTSHLAGEFLVAGELSRRGYPVSITLGNAKSVDIHAETSRGIVKVQAKAVRNKGNWPIREDSIEEDIFYIFVFLQTKTAIKGNKASEYFVAKRKDLKDLVQTWGTRQGIRYSSLNKERFKERWDKLPPPIGGQGVKLNDS